LFRYASSGVRQLTSGGGSPSYFSIDSGATSLDRWNSNPASGDLGDWNTSAGDDALNNASFSGVINSLTTTDVINMSALGFVTAVSVSSRQTVSITSSQTSSG
jgi:hypothetical protein